MSLVLASASPRRREILSAAGFSFTVRAPRIAEIRSPEEQPLQYVKRLAAEKAGAVAIVAGELVLAADTVVVKGDQVLEKPTDEADARRMLSLLSGAEHQVITGICLRTQASAIVDAAVTRVRFAELSAEEITGYVSSGEPFDKAGAYAIQGLASKFVEHVEGCYFNIVGLPISLVYRYLKELGYQP